MALTMLTWTIPQNDLSVHNFYTILLQLHFMFQVLVDSLSIVGKSSPFKFDKEIRQRYAEEIFSQQNEKLKEFKDEWLHEKRIGNYASQFALYRWRVVRVEQ